MYADLTDESIRCRVNGHIWRPYDASRVVGAFEVQEQCERCHSDRFSTISNRGEVMARHLRYPDGYLKTDGPMQPGDRDAMRLQVIKWDYKF